MKIRILIVDDDIGGAQLLKLRLENHGRYKVYTEHSGAGALPAAHKYRPHVILLDVHMPGHDGGEVAAQIRADSNLHRTPIIFVTALVSADDYNQGRFISGGYPFLSKSIGTDQIIACVEHEVARACSDTIANAPALLVTN